MSFSRRVLHAPPDFPASAPAVAGFASAATGAAGGGGQGLVDLRSRGQGCRGGALFPFALDGGRVFTRFRPAGAEVWLTIDDGPDPVDTPRLLDLLERHRARASFFLIGARA